MAGPPFLVDLHVHTRNRSHDSALDPALLTLRAVEQGHAAVCITDHNACWTAAEAAELADRSGLPVLRGMEVGTNVGHVLAFGLDAFHRDMWDIEHLRRAADLAGGVLVLAHPLRPPGFPRSWDQLPELFDGLEVINADESATSAVHIEELAAKYGLAATGGSDAHTARAIGRALTAFAAPLASDADLVAAIRARTCWPVLGLGRP